MTDDSGELADGAVSPNQVVESALGELKNLASLPQVGIKLSRLLDNPDTTSAEIEQVIETDPSLTTRILKVVNSSYYGMARQIVAVNEAVVFLGMKAVKNIALASSFDKFYRQKNESTVVDARRIWVHSVAVATVAKELAGQVPTEGETDQLIDQAFFAGLVHNIGMIVEMQIKTELFAKAVERFSCGECRCFAEAESQVIGATHEDFGAALCRKWNLPESLESVTGFHHRPQSTPRPHRQLTTIVHLADLLVCGMGFGIFDSTIQEPLDSDLLESLKLTPDVLANLEQTLQEKVVETTSLFSFSE